MIERIRIGMRIMLPSGNIVRVIALRGYDAVCEYTHLARARGEVVFRAAFLRERGTRV